MSAHTGDFASRAMLEVLAAGLHAQGIDVAPPSAGPAKVPRSDKSSLLETIVAQHGAGVLLHLDAGLEQLAGRPIEQALLAGGGPWDLLSRWGRLERYVHGRHRTRRTPIAPASGGDHACLVEHHATDGSTPHALESLAVLAVLGALLRRAGARNLQAVVVEADLFGPTGAAHADRLVASGVALSWRHEWRTHDRPATDRSRQTLPFEARTPRLREVLAVTSSDLLRRWRIDDVAAAIGLGARVLQRELAAEGWTFTAIQAQTRQAEAARLLRETDAPLAEIGYLCGYSDQAHFTRQFERDVGVTPGKYRLSFRTESPSL
ncbi:MAG: helix-turn-helix transcriptional regulator [Silanimonas sp.]|jgi:AraC-like DNA-binding protein|nr:helix-turn-helix transcriptional regulator [Silanimonas sp.]